MGWRTKYFILSDKYLSFYESVNNIIYIVVVF